MSKTLSVLIGLCAATGVALAADGPASEPAGPTLRLLERHGHVTPRREGFQHTAGGNVYVWRPAPDTVAIRATGVAVAGAHPCKDSIAAQDVDLSQCFEVLPGAPGKKLTLSVEGRVVGLLRTHCKGGGGVAEESACASIACGPTVVCSLALPPHSVAAGESLSVNDHAAVAKVPVLPGTYTLQGNFRVAVTHPHSLVPYKAGTAEFAPEPALDPHWISVYEPFHGAHKKEFGFQVVIKVSAE